MEPLNAKEFPPERVQRLLSGVPFFNQILKQDEAQFQLLFDNTSFLRAERNEVVIRRGDDDRGLYFLLRGDLNVWGKDESTPLYRISAGEIFGTLAMLRGAARSATLMVPEECKEAILAHLDYALFSEDDGSRQFTLATRLAFFHMIVHNIRWALEMKRVADPHHPLVSEMLQMPLFVGARNTAEELHSLSEQAHLLADILYRWNEST